MTTDNRTVLNPCDANTNWTGDDGTPTVRTVAGLYYENAASLSFQHTNAAEHTYYTDGTGWNLSDATCFLCVKDNQQDSQLNGGQQYVLGDGTDRLGVETNGSDNPGVQLGDLFYGMNIDVTNRTSFTLQNYAGVNANLTTTAITQVGYGSVHLAKAQGAVDNVYLDYLAYIANDSAALTINGGTVGTPETWTDVAGDDVTNGWGMVGNPFADQFQTNASFDIGDATAATDSYFEMDGVQLYLFGQAYGATHAFWGLTSNVGGTNSMVINGSAIISIAGTTGSPYDLNWNETNFNIINVDGSLFVDVGNVTLPANSATRYIRTSTFDNPTTITPNTMEISDTTLIAGTNTAANGLMVLDTSGDSNNCANLDFVSDGAGHAIEISVAGTYDFDNFNYTGYGADGTTNAEVYISVNAAVTINIQNGGATPTIRNSGTAPTINNAVTIKIDGIAEGTAGTMIANETLGTVTAGDVLLEGIANSLGEIEDTAFNYEAAFGAGIDVVVRARNQGLAQAAIADDGGVQTDQTANANSPATNDMTLTPAVPVVNDAYYFGHNEEFSQLKVWVTTAGVNQTITWEYWNGAWVALSGVSDGTSSFTTAGDNIVSWTAPSDWADTTVNSQGPYRYVRARVSAIGAGPTGAQARQCQLDVTRYLPIPPSGLLVRTITSAGLTATLSQAVDSISRPFG